MSLKHLEIDDHIEETKRQTKIMKLLNELVTSEAAKTPLNELEVIERTILYIKLLQCRLKTRKTA